jgi:L-ascorbate metabolism protein UlaG (beta-lactamase superfamily)
MRIALAAAAALLLAACTPSPVPLHRPYHPSDADLTVTRIVHGSVILDLRGTRVIVDPWFYSGWFTRQLEPLGVVPTDLPPLAAVLVTHRHADRFDARALRDLAAHVPLAIAPPGLVARLRDLGFGRVEALDWWDRTTVDGLTVTAVPARHSVRENGYVLEADGLSAYVAGDTRLFSELADVATRFPHLDVAVLPVGGERMLGLKTELGPEDAARAAATLDARRIVPFGYGERPLYPFRWYAGRPIIRFTEACAERGIDRGRIVVLEPGESWHYYR